MFGRWLVFKMVHGLPHRVGTLMLLPEPRIIPGPPVQGPVCPMQQFFSVTGTPEVDIIFSDNSAESTHPPLA